jgi:ferredoxin
MGLHPLADRELCLGTGICLTYAPGTFAHDDEGKVVVANLAGDPADAISAAVEACPTSALRLITAETEA